MARVTPKHFDYMIFDHKTGRYVRIVQQVLRVSAVIHLEAKGTSNLILEVRT